MITIQGYKQAVEKVKELNIIKDTKNTEFNKSVRTIENRYYKLINKLKERQTKEENTINNKREKFNKKIENPKKQYSEKISEFKRIIDLIETSKKKVDLNIELYKYDYPRDYKGNIIYNNGNYPSRERIYLKPLSILKDNEFYKIAVYVYENSKPKNKFTLCVVGRSIFDSEKILGFCWGYLSDINENGHFKKESKCFPTHEELIKWFGENQNKLFQYEINKIEETIKEYKEVIKNTTFKEWEIAYLESKKDYYENRYSHGEETKEYAKIINKLIDLTTGKEREKYTKILKNLIVENLTTKN